MHCVLLYPFPLTPRSSRHTTPHHCSFCLAQHFKAEGPVLPIVPAIQGTEAYHNPLSTLSTSDARFDTVHLDIVGPLLHLKGLHICIDRFTRWPEAIPIPKIRAESVAEAFVRSQGLVPTTDRGHSNLHFGGS
jgi:hypothetical protein